MSVNIDMDRLNEHDRMIAAETIPQPKEGRPVPANAQSK